MDASAQLIALTLRYAELFAHAFAYVRAVFPPARGAVVAGGDYLVVFHKDSAEIPPQTGPPLCDSLGYVQVVVSLVASFHFTAFQPEVICASCSSAC